MLACVLQSTMAPFQRVQNAAVRMVKRLGSLAHITEARRTCTGNLHWLPIKYRVIYKLCIRMHLVHIGCGLGFISELVSATSALPGHSRLRSSGGSLWDPLDNRHYAQVTSTLLTKNMSIMDYSQVSAKHIHSTRYAQLEISIICYIIILTVCIFYVNLLICKMNLKNG